MAAQQTRPEVVEEFTFRSPDASITVNAVVDTGATRTVITDAIVAALDLKSLRQSPVALAGGSQANAGVYHCVVAWTIYEGQGYWSEHDVMCLAGGEEVLLGYDFLAHHELKVDLHHKGLVGSAPDAAVAFTGGGYVINPPRGLVLETNYRRVQAAKPGQVLRPHPAWRFKLPAIVKQERMEQDT